jgi:signal transduction histidine kinase
LNIEYINVNECVSEALARFNNKSKKKNIKVVKTFPEDDIYIKTDNYFLTIILNN